MFARQCGSYNLTEPEMAERLQRRKTENIFERPARKSSSQQPGCLLQIAPDCAKQARGTLKRCISDYLDRATK